MNKSNERKWPALGLELYELEWTLRFGTPVSKEDCLYAASVISAYRELVLCPWPKREMVVRELRKEG